MKIWIRQSVSQNKSISFYVERLREAESLC